MLPALPLPLGPRRRVGIGGLQPAGIGCLRGPLLIWGLIREGVRALSLVWISLRPLGRNLIRKWVRRLGLRLILSGIGVLRLLGWGLVRGRHLEPRLLNPLPKIAPLRARRILPRLLHGGSKPTVSSGHGLLLILLRLELVLQLVDLGILLVQALPEALIALLKLLEVLVILLEQLSQPLRFLRLIQQQLQKLPAAQFL